MACSRRGHENGLQYRGRRPRNGVHRARSLFLWGESKRLVRRATSVLTIYDLFRPRARVAVPQREIITEAVNMLVWICSQTQPRPSPPKRSSGPTSTWKRYYRNLRKKARNFWTDFVPDFWTDFLTDSCLSRFITKISKSRGF